MEKLPKIVTIVGPTASGKTGLAIKIAGWLSNQSRIKKFAKIREKKSDGLANFNGAEIVSADSRQIYRGMDIGTAKTTSKEQKAIKHHLINIKNPDEEYTVAEYKKDAITAINKILDKGKLPILVGGTGLYIDAVVDNLEIPEVKPNPLLRKKLEGKIKKYGVQKIYDELIKLDPEAAYIIDKNNPRRIIRAIEIIKGSGKLYSEQRKKGLKLFEALKIGINPGNKILQKRINERVDLMTKDGLIKEVKNLLKKYPANLTAFDAIGYREIINYLRKEITFEEATNQIKRNTWQYAKRQITWLKKDKEINWINPHTYKG